MRVRTRAHDNCFVSERRDHERAKESILRMTARFHLSFDNTARAEVETE